MHGTQSIRAWRNDCTLGVCLETDWKLWAVSHEDCTSRVPTSTQQSTCLTSGRALNFAQGSYPQSGEGKAECERSDKRKQICDLFALAQWRGHDFGAKWEIPLWSPWWGTFPEKANSEYVYVEAAWLIITLHIERDQTSTKCFCWKQMMCPFSLAGGKLFLQRADFVI